MIRFALLAVVVVCGAFAQDGAQDGDRDGLDDAIEDRLLRRFAPRLQVSASDCDVAPASFASGEAVPRAVARDGTIYGQAFPKGEFVELHYYHLWARDCGRSAHALDAEHVSALVDARAGRAVYWYAAAHEGTLCDMSSGVRAARIQAEDRGPRVWVSEGKHASFLSEEACRGNCGGDRCSSGREVAVSRIINIGERGVPLNGAVWVSSPEWPLEAKMVSDFAPEQLARLDAAKGITPLDPSPLALRKMLFGGVHLFDGLGKADSETSRAVERADHKASGAIRGSLRRAKEATAAKARSAIAFVETRPAPVSPEP